MVNNDQQVLVARGILEEVNISFALQAVAQAEIKFATDKIVMGRKYDTTKILQVHENVYIRISNSVKAEIKGEHQTFDFENFAYAVVPDKLTITATFHFLGMYPSFDLTAAAIMKEKLTGAETKYLVS